MPPASDRPNPGLTPNHPRGEGCVFAFFLLTMTGYAMLLIYVLGATLLTP